ncbi:MAG: Crp/Fnr family transcriptional regulator [Nitrosomonas sp.]|uniref:Crp/Fnr family transcriptional regulator n=1 Tax=Nitrosomonas sp. TaxID=42353 RepID=UPI00272FBCC5|nr:Crp/Fnr family transcriptional regulator [Nitrosomonas sp.]MDP1788109.1 Crp/Fnr family transcriptional regulator [Nitrosomonas sp.]MDP3282674.1 Crp/Fnr family transcriptional regulator [Nitrosomonas sp.]MDP3662995.1 Crp/Fnr family transcriptional regulator [Nitrosomonas sp.]MDZ4106972.1 Crp/Fnr family transcriptional regulator [Nitrosomonas sp.]
MSAVIPVVTNHLISCLSREERNRFLQHCEPLELVFGDILCELDQPIQYVYFPLAGFISLVISMEGHQPLEVGLIGNEGMLGATLALEVADAPLKAVVQGSGSALRMTAAQFQHELRNSPCMLSTLNRYLYVLVMQLSQTAACTHFHEIEPRLARWLLMTHDRAHADHFHLTQEYLADMLGVRRSSITIAAGKLQQQKLISYIRGEINILDRKALEAASCACYNILNDHYVRLFP